MTGAARNYSKIAKKRKTKGRNNNCLKETGGKACKGTFNKNKTKAASILSIKRNIIII